MLDHVFIDAIDSVRQSLERAHLERSRIEEGFANDVLAGDLVWETAYALPGENLKPAIRAELNLSWVTWSQSAYRDWMVGESPDTPPSLDMEVIFMISQLSEVPDIAMFYETVGRHKAGFGDGVLALAAPTMAHTFDTNLEVVSTKVEASFEGDIELSDTMLESSEALDEAFADLGGWVAATLVSLGDLNLR